MSVTLTIPGLGGSGSDHWQSHWEDLYSSCRSIQTINWNIPDKENWLDSLDHYIRQLDEPPLLAAHSLGCALLAHWAIHRNSVPIKGAILVAPTDVDNRITLPAEALCFSPMPLGLFPFPSTVIASNNDHYVTPKRAQAFASAWGSNFLNIGDRGHINADTHLEGWKQGWDLLQNLPNSNKSEQLSQA